MERPTHLFCFCVCRCSCSCLCSCRYGCHPRRGICCCCCFFFHQPYCAIRQGEAVPHPLNSFVAQSVDLSLWHEVQGFGIPDCSVSTGVINRNVCALAKLSLIVCSI